MGDAWTLSPPTSGGYSTPPPPDYRLEAGASFICPPEPSHKQFHTAIVLIVLLVLHVWALAGFRYFFPDKFETFSRGCSACMNRGKSSGLGESLMNVETQSVVTNPVTTPAQA